MSERYHIPLLNGRVNFAIWKSCVEDYLVQIGIDGVLLKERPKNIWEAKWTHMRNKAVRTI